MAKTKSPSRPGRPRATKKKAKSASRPGTPRATKKKTKSASRPGRPRATKKRTTVPKEMATEVLFGHDWSCCICGEKRGLQIHHIDGEPSNHARENLAVLCHHHHEDTQIRGGFGRRVTASVVKKYRDEWFIHVSGYRQKALEISALRLAGAAKDFADSTNTGVGQPRVETHTVLEPAGFTAASPSVGTPELQVNSNATSTVITEPTVQWHEPKEEGYRAFVELLPSQFREACNAARPLWESSYLPMVEGSNLVIEVLKHSWIILSAWYPPNHFGLTPSTYVENYLADRYAWHRALADADNDPTAIGGSKAAIASGQTVFDAARLIAETVRAVAYRLEGFNLEEWERAWDEIVQQMKPF